MRRGSVTPDPMGLAVPRTPSTRSRVGRHADHRDGDEHQRQPGEPPPSRWTEGGRQEAEEPAGCRSDRGRRPNRFSRSRPTPTDRRAGGRREVPSALRCCRDDAARTSSQSWRAASRSHSLGDGRRSDHRRRRRRRSMMANVEANRNGRRHSRTPQGPRMNPRPRGYRQGREHQSQIAGSWGHRACPQRARGAGCMVSATTARRSR